MRGSQAIVDPSVPTVRPEGQTSEELYVLAAEVKRFGVTESCQVAQWAVVEMRRRQSHPTDRSCYTTAHGEL